MSPVRTCLQAKQAGKMIPILLLTTATHPAARFAMHLCTCCHIGGCDSLSFINMRLFCKCNVCVVVVVKKKKSVTLARVFV